MISSSDYNLWQKRQSPPAKPRKQRFAGIYSEEKAWQLEMMRGPGVFIPLRVVSEANTREQWWVKSARTKAQKQAVRQYMGEVKIKLPAVIVMTRYGKRELDDDNLAGAFKHVRDSIAAIAGVDDRSKLYRWVPQQEIAKFYGIRIEIQPIEPDNKSADSGENLFSAT